MAQVPVGAISPRTVTMGLLELLAHVGTQLIMQGFLVEQVGCWQLTPGVMSLVIN